MTFIPRNAAGLLAEFGSPLYVYDASLIEQALHIPQNQGDRITFAVPS